MRIKQVGDSLYLSFITDLSNLTRQATPAAPINIIRLSKDKYAERYLNTYNYKYKQNKGDILLGQSLAHKSPQASD